MLDGVEFAANWQTLTGSNIGTTKDEIVPSSWM